MLLKDGQGGLVEQSINWNPATLYCLRESIYCLGGRVNYQATISIPGARFAPVSA